jgi:pyruvate ferredoxin oxidoreductase beta subunit/2-oxoisovalerate ferredoxin oxidoreductase beta subunit
MTMPTVSEASCHCDAVLRPGNTNCAGCGMSIGYQLLDQALEREPITLVIPACCGIVTAGAFPTSAYGVPTAASTFAGAAAVGTGLTTVAQLNGEDHPVICWAGDGGTYDIGLATLSAAAERNENMIYVCYDNEIYGNTGGQRSSATPEGVRTTTTPGGKREAKKDIMGIMVAHKIPYAATLSVAHREDFLRKIRTARRTSGFRFLLMLSPCPTGWKSEPDESVDLIRHVVGCGAFPLYEVMDGVRYRINARPDGTPLEAYASRQRRYTSSGVDLSALEARIKDQWRYLDAMGRAFPWGDDAPGQAEG